MTLRPDMAPMLLPRPRRLELTGGRVAVDVACAAERIDPEAEFVFGGDEAYRVHVTHAVQAPVVIEARTQAGVRYARATLAQLARQYGEMLPCLVIEDAPVLAVRGYMLDISRDRVPTKQHLREIVDLLASLKYNHLQLYTEHTFGYEGHDDVWRDASPMTADEVRELDRYCQKRGIELAANQNCFGHLAKWLRLPRYALLAETHGEWYFENGGQRWPRKGPFSLCPTDPASLEFVQGLLDELLPCFTSPLVNIGCDETFDVGFGRSADAVRERGRASVYLEFVDKVAAHVRGHGKRPMFWADIALGYPEHAELIASDMIRLAWGYEAETPWTEWLGVLRAGEFDPASEQKETWVCPGTSSWRSITGRTSERRANITGAAREGAAGGARGLLLTDWGDGGHRQQWVVSLPAIAQAADAAWRGGEGPDIDSKALSLHILEDATLKAGGWLDELGDVDAALRRVCGRRRAEEAAVPLRNASALYIDLHLPLHPGPDDDAALRAAAMSSRRELWEEIPGKLDDLLRRKPDGLAGDVEAELRHTIEVAQLAARRAVLRRREGGISAANARELARHCQGVIDEHRELWLVRSREGGLAASAAHYQAIMEDLLS